MAGYPSITTNKLILLSYYVILGLLAIGAGTHLQLYFFFTASIYFITILNIMLSNFIIINF